MISKRLVLAAIISSFSALSHAGFTVSPMAVFHWFDSNANKIENDSQIGLGLGYRSQNMGIELDAHQTDTRFMVGSPRVGTHDVTNKAYSLNGYYAFNDEGTVQPFVLLGVGQNQVRHQNIGVEKDTIGNLGLGAFVKLNDNLALRGELRGVHNIDNSNTDTLALVGLQVDFGKKAAVATPVVTPTPEPTPEPVAIVTPADDDKDGVINSQDNCPETAAGVAVNAQGCALDSDKDGVVDNADSCPNTPQGAKIDGQGCPLDTDKDGVADYLDQCAETPSGALVDANGCPKILTEALKEEIKVIFDTNKSIVKDEFKNEVTKVATLAKQYPTATIEIQGHTDSRGNKAKNQKLSQDRANAVRDLLINGYGIDAARVSAKGYGADQPVADNKTEAGRTANRRVIAVTSGEVKKVQTKSSR